ncbi:transporter [Hahella sp. CCB-MM4]|uniref:LysE family translocator n=1 Tax=Hahella sp. (strain CCB-MM4) TaxID=1926491 RepID=UPI000B9A5FA2|nr:LysE family transporter [Hahella sp. CCB-MM4]OZG70173.1 transporter [Hahella sp. CCB-MM4]
MLEIFAYAVGIMYSPGPVNLLALNLGMNGRFRSSVSFYLGVGCALFLMFMVFGYTGAWLVDEGNRLVISILGCGYIFYLGIKLGMANLKISDQAQEPIMVGFREGLLMQLLNPKGLIATLPIATLQFPAENIVGSKIFLCSALLSILAVGAPGIWAFIGAGMIRRYIKPGYFRYLNMAMSLLLILVACDIAYGELYAAI